MDKIKYRKFVGRAGDLAGYSSIRLADDHILLCEDIQFTERYKRFYFKDIQGLVVKKTINSLMTSIFVFVLGLGSVWFLAHSKKGVWHLFWEILTGFDLFILVINILKGQSCRTYIQTAVQNERLSGINTVRKFKKFLKVIQPYIQSAQGELDRQTLETKYEESLAHASLEGKLAAGQMLLPEQESPLHTILFFSFIVFSLLIGGVYALNDALFAGLSCCMFVVVFVLTIIAAVRQSRGRIKKAIATWTWGCLAGIGAFSVMAYISFFTLIFTMEKHHHRFEPVMPSAGEYLKYIPYSPFVHQSLLFFFYLLLALGLVGLVLSVKSRHVDKPSV